MITSVVRSPFPGVDPYLEHPEIFPDLHLAFASGKALAEVL